MSDNDSKPILIAPPPGYAHAESTAESSNEVDSQVDGPFITLPPGVLDSATHRLTTSRVREAPEISNPSDVAGAATAGLDDVVFFPAPIGLAPERADGGTEDREEPTWGLILPGEPNPVSVPAALFVGRDPTRTDDRPDSQLLAVIDPAKSVSKTHAMFEVDDDRLYVVDLDSTNGVFLFAPSGEAVQVAPRVRTRVPVDSMVGLGNYPIRLHRD